MELLIGNENHSLTLHAYVAGFDKSGHNYISDKRLTVHIEHVQCQFTKLNFIITKIYLQKFNETFFNNY